MLNSAASASVAAARTTSRALTRQPTAPKPLVGEQLAPYIEKVEAAKKELKAHDKISRELMFEKHECAGLAFVTFATKAEAEQCVRDLSQQRAMAQSKAAKGSRREPAVHADGSPPDPWEAAPPVPVDLVADEPRLVRMQREGFQLPSAKGEKVDTWWDHQQL